MADPDVARALIARYRAHQVRDREAIAWIDAGGRHYDQATGRTEFVDTTASYRSDRVSHIEMLDDLIRLYQRDV